MEKRRQKNAQHIVFDLGIAAGFFFTQIVSVLLHLHWDSPLARSKEGGVGGSSNLQLIALASEDMSVRSRLQLRFCLGREDQMMT